MLHCPSCANQAIPFGSAWRSSVVHPARCAACGSTCYVSSSASGVALLAALGLALAGTASAAVMLSWPVLVAGLAVAAVVYVLLWRRIRPVAVTAMPAAAPSRATAGLALLDVLALLVLWK